MIQTVSCQTCAGRGRFTQGYERIRVLGTDHTTFDPDAVPERAELDLSDGFEVSSCYFCHGVKGPDGLSYARYEYPGDTHPTAYKNATTLKTAMQRPNPKAKPCIRCNGIGLEAQVPVVRDCYHCHGDGTDLVRIDPGDVLPEGFDLYRKLSKPAAAHYAHAVDIVIQRHSDAVLTAGAALLGLGTIYTIQDYGRALNADDAVVLTDVRKHLTDSGTQYINLAPRDTRRIADAVLVNITRNGYTVTTLASRESANRAMLPPSYTNGVLNQPYNR